MRNFDQAISSPSDRAMPRATSVVLDFGTHACRLFAMGAGAEGGTWDPRGDSRMAEAD